MEKIEQEKKISKIEKFSYTLVFFVSMGSKFFSFTVFGVHLNVARILMIIPLFFLIVDILKKKRIDCKFANKEIKYCLSFLVIWCVFSVLSIFRTKDINYFLIKNFFICIGTIDILFFMKYIDVEKNKKILLNIINASAMINCIYYLYLYFIKGENIGGFYHNSNDFATILLFVIPIAIYFIKNSKQKKFYIIDLILYIICFVNVESRGCILGVCFATFIYLILKAFKNRVKILQNRVLGIVFVCCLALLIIFGIVLLHYYLGKLQLTPIQNAKTSNEVRMNIIWNGLYFLKNDWAWLIGIGAGNAEFYLHNYSIYTTHGIYSFHNPILEIAVTYGIPILIGFLIMCYTILKNLGKRVYYEEKFSLTTVFFLYLLALVVANISSSTILTREWFWLFLAITISYTNTMLINKKDGDKVNEEKNNTNHISSNLVNE